MCLASLHLSTLPCGHRYYKLIRPCEPGVNLLTCPTKLALSGWETRSNECPFCDPENTDLSCYRLVAEPGCGGVGGLGGATSTSLVSTRRSTISSSKRNSLVRSDSGTGSLYASSEGGAGPCYNSATISSLPSLTPTQTLSSDSGAGVGLPACPLAQLSSHKNRAQNARIESYFWQTGDFVHPGSRANSTGASTPRRPSSQSQGEGVSDTARSSISSVAVDTSGSTSASSLPVTRSTSKVNVARKESIGDGKSLSKKLRSSSGRKSSKDSVDEKSLEAPRRSFSKRKLLGRLFK